MKVLMLSTTDVSGGAAIAAHRLHKQLRLSNLDSRMLVQDKLTDEIHVESPVEKYRILKLKIGNVLEKLPFKLYPNRQKTTFYFQWAPGISSEQINKYAKDIVHLHWICRGFMRIERLAQIKAPLVWTLHDMWPFTGGCNYSADCVNYRESCGSCPQLSGRNKNDLSNWVWRRKKRCWGKLNLTVVAPSNWMARCASESSLFAKHRIEVIPNGLDLNIFKPIDKELARQLLDLPKNRKLILFGADFAFLDTRKGYHLLEETLLILKQRFKDPSIEIVIFGASAPAEKQNLGFPVHYLGRFHDEISIALLYSAADVFIAPSLQDNLPNTIMEASACGTPCAAFRIGGIPDLIEDRETGYLASPGDSNDLAFGVEWLLCDLKRYKTLADKSRHKSENEFSVEMSAKRYRSLYEEVINNYNETQK